MISPRFAFLNRRHELPVNINRNGSENAENASTRNIIVFPLAFSIFNFVSWTRLAIFFIEKKGFFCRKLFRRYFKKQKDDKNNHRSGLLLRRRRYLWSALILVTTLFKKIIHWDLITEQARAKLKIFFGLLSGKGVGGRGGKGSYYVTPKVLIRFSRQFSRCVALLSAIFSVKREPEEWL